MSASAFVWVTIRDLSDISLPASQPRHTHLILYSRASATTRILKLCSGGNPGQSLTDIKILHTAYHEHYMTANCRPSQHRQEGEVKALRKSLNNWGSLHWNVQLCWTVVPFTVTGLARGDIMVGRAHNSLTRQESKKSSQESRDTRCASSEMMEFESKECR